MDKRFKKWIELRTVRDWLTQKWTININVKDSGNNEFICDIYRKNACTDAIIPNNLYYQIQYKMVMI